MVDLQNENIKVIYEENLTNNSITINENLNASDLMITDYSSLGTEYLFFNKPNIYINTDAEEYLQKRKLWLGNLNDGGCENICRYFFDGDELNKNLVKHVDSVKCYKDRVDELVKYWMRKMKLLLTGKTE